MALEAVLRGLLSELDALAEALCDEDFDDLNAEFEDALLMLSEADPEDPEELAEARAEFDALAEDYRRWPQAAALAGRLSEAVAGPG